MNHCLVHEESVAEIQGYYGSLTVAERIFQEIWKLQDFDSEHLHTQDGKRLRILHPGHWNHQDGPDFRAAKIRMEDRCFEGDIELHLYPKEWKQHGHSRDPAFRNVLLHVTLFDGKSPGGAFAPRDHLVLLPFLNGDLESVLTQYALKRSFSGDPTEEPWVQELLRFGSDVNAQHAHLLHKARLRWKLKVDFARERLRRVGWQEACHQMMLEVMGYRRNRAVMHQIAVKFPLQTFDRGRGWEAREVFERFRYDWKLQGIRPANQPLRRLEAYHRLLLQEPRWPALLLAQVDLLDLPTAHSLDGITPANMGRLRKELGILLWLGTVKSGLFNDVVGGSRLHTLFCDAFLPLLAAELDLELFVPWFLWPAGDYPALFQKALRLTALSQCQGTVNCSGWMQAFLQLMFESE